MEKIKMRKKGMTSHQAAGATNDEWLTPPWIIAGLAEVFDFFDLDPCTPEEMPWQTAKVRYKRSEDGLSKLWYGNVWLNPPYSQIDVWLKKLSEHGHGMALVFARTETKNFFENVWPHAHAIHFIKGRLYFYYPNGSKAKSNGGAPSVLVAYGAENAIRLEKSVKLIPGHFIKLK